RACAPSGTGATHYFYDTAATHEILAASCGCGHENDAIAMSAVFEAAPHFEGLGMLSVNVPRGTSLERTSFGADGELPDRAVWIDLYSPTQGEDKLVERALGIAVPTREEMQEIEVTSRLYVENNARYMTATLMCHSDTDVPRTTAVTFILSGHRLVTV